MSAPAVVAGDAAARARALRLMIFDVDGVLTDGRLYMGESGEELKAFHVRDGLGLQLLRDAGLEVALLTSRRSDLVARRAAELGIRQVRQGVADKRSGFRELLATCKVDAAAAGYMGDDLVDLSVLTACGFAASVAEAPQAVRDRVHYVSRLAGGQGAVREVCEFVLQAQGALEAAVGKFLK
ncbi:MAG TPA: phenylphosphate carboxylase subunit delta [Burkholderiales bacterium]|nr:phenylphosphate carboxylase subunit delta [Burkholderiales bacterium]